MEDKEENKGALVLTGNAAMIIPASWFLMCFKGLLLYVTLISIFRLHPLHFSFTYSQYSCVIPEVNLLIALLP
jgi:hypothetical protein